DRPHDAAVLPNGLFALRLPRLRLRHRRSLPSRSGGVPIDGAPSGPCDRSDDHGRRERLQQVATEELVPGPFERPSDGEPIAVGFQIRLELGGLMAPWVCAGNAAVETNRDRMAELEMMRHAAD